MKKYLLTKVGKDGKEKSVPVFIPEETAILLDQCEEEIRRVYLEEEYKASKKGRAEIRRHISLDAAMENGFDIENSEQSAIELMLSKEEKDELVKCIGRLPVRQKQVVELYILKGNTMEQTAKEMGCYVSNVHKLFQKSLRNLKNFLARG